MGFQHRIVLLGLAATAALAIITIMALNQAAAQTLLMAGTGGTIAVLSITFLLAWQSKKSVCNLRQAIERVGDSKDLSLRIDARQHKEFASVANAINTLLNAFGDILGRINRNTELLFEAVAQIASASAEVTVSSDTQSESVSGVADTMGQLNDSVSQVAQNASEVRLMAGSAKDLSQKGVSHVELVAHGIEHVNELFQSTQNLIQSLSRRSDEIVKIIEMISDIAEQTNLLALNAAIEAARAGEQGRGFAVVADEVRNLASRTHEATNEVTRMVDGIRKETTTIVEQINAGGKEVEACVEKARQTSDVLSQVNNNAVEVTNRTDEIAAATEEQSRTTQHIEEMVQTVTEMTLKSNQSIHRANDAIRKLLQQAMALIMAAREYSPVARNELNELMQTITEIRMNAVLTTNASSAGEAAVPIDAIKRLDDKVEMLWQRYSISPHATSHSELADNFWKQWQEFKAARAITLERSAREDFNGARENAANNAGPKFQKAKAALSELINTLTPDSITTAA